MNPKSLELSPTIWTPPIALPTTWSSTHSSRCHHSPTHSPGPTHDPPNNPELCPWPPRPAHSSRTPALMHCVPQGLEGFLWEVGRG